MQKSRKKFWIVFSCVCAAIIVLCSVFAFATKLKTVTVEFRTRLAQDETVLEKGILDKVLQSGDFKYGKSVLFMNFEDNIANIEKSNPYVKVEQIVRHFPNIARVYISERIPMYRMQDLNEESKWYILDADFKVVAIVDGDVKQAQYGNSTYYEKTIEITPDSITIDSYIGAFVNDEVDRKNLNTIASGVKARASVISGVKSIKIESKNNFTFTLTMKNSGINNDDGCEIVIVGQDNLRTKVLAGISCFCEETENKETFDLSKKKITIEEVGGVLEGVMTDK